MELYVPALGHHNKQSELFESSKIGFLNCRGFQLELPIFLEARVFKNAVTVLVQFSDSDFLMFSLILNALQRTVISV